MSRAAQRTLPIGMGETLFFWFLARLLFAGRFLFFGFAIVQIYGLIRSLGKPYFQSAWASFFRLRIMRR
jgi:hypothetical protein